MTVAISVVKKQEKKKQITFLSLFSW